MSGLGKQHHLEPVTDSDKVMSARHKAHRREVDNMKDGPEKLRKSLIYNGSHMREHQKAFTEAKDKLKMAKKESKSRSKMFK